MRFVVADSPVVPGTAPAETTIPLPPSWVTEAWQLEIVRLLQRDFCQELQAITWEDIDWAAWECYFAQGKSPREAIERALERDI